MHSFLLATPSSQEQFRYLANHSVLEFTKTVGRSSTRLGYPFHLAIMFTLKMIIIQQVFVRLRSGQPHGLHNLGHQLLVSVK